MGGFFSDRFQNARLNMTPFRFWGQQNSVLHGLHSICLVAKIDISGVFELSSRPTKELPIILLPTFFHMKSASSTVAERSKYQQNIIRNYYENRENISLQRAQEIVTELYLSEGKKREKYWKSLEGHLLKLDVKQQTIDHLIAQNDPMQVAKLVEKLGKQ